MARHYSTKSFFRQVPNALLASYFQSRGLLSELDFTALSETKPDKLFAAWLELPEVERKPIDADFQDIFELSCEKGFLAIIDEARWQMRGAPDQLAEVVEMLSALPDHYQRAMTTFLGLRQFWDGAVRFHHADNLPYWRKRKNMGHNLAAVDDASIRQLARQIRDYFHSAEGRGNNCVVEPLRRGELDYYFAYPEDYSQQSTEWVNGEFGRRPHNPAFEVIFVYSQKEGTLDLNFRGAKNAVEPLQGMFATTILNLDELPPDPKDERIYDLNPLRQKGFQFIPALGSGIQNIAVRKLRLSSKVKKGDRITLEADATHNPDSVYDLLDKIGKSVPLHSYNITQVEIAATIAVGDGAPPKAVTIRITHPNSCSLKYDEIDLKLRDMLNASGIEPKDPPPDSEGPEA